jgi:hypothetical protein
VGRGFTFSLFRLVFTEDGAAVQGAPMGISRLFGGPGFNQRETWLLTLSKTVWVLLHLHNYVQASLLRYTVMIP